MRGASAALVVSVLAAVGCAPKPPTPVNEPPPLDAWDRTPPTKDWEFATKGAGTDKERQCSAVIDWIKGEEHCKAASCSRGLDLSKEWTSRCSGVWPGSVKTVKGVGETLAERAKEPSDCAARAEAFL